jgi:alpha-2-macroglobulin-like protein
MLKANDHMLEQVDACLHGLLSDADAAIVRKHCDDCPICRVAWDEAQKRFDSLASLPALETSSELIERTERRLAKAPAPSRLTVPLRWLERRSLFARFGITAASVALVIGAIHLYYLTIAASPYDLRVLGQETLLSGAESSLRVVVYDNRSQSLMAGIPVEVDLERPWLNESVRLASFQTDVNGTGSPRFRLPDWKDGSYKLRVAARIGRCEEVTTHDVALHRAWQVMVSTDKPVYRPGDAIRIRSLSLRRPDLKPIAGEKMTLSVTDPKGNVIFRHGDVTSRYGIASADCALADEILLGTYRIECQVGDTTSASAVEVKKYVLPKFQVTLDADRPYYRPDETISGTIRADYFFGKPVADAAVRIELASAKEGEKAADTLAARTDKSGKAAFSIRIPASLAQAAEAAEEAPFNMTATVVDSAGQTESRTISRVVTASPLRIEVIPESGRLVPGVSNVVYLLTTYADGRPAVTRLVVSGFDHEIATSATGVATAEFKPETAKEREIAWTIRATDGQGVSSRKEVKLPVGRWSDDFVVRTDRAVYAGGQTMHVSAIGRGTEPVLIDLVKDGQTVLTDAISLVDGRGEYAFVLPPDLFGTVELSAYRFRREGRALQKRRVLYIHQANALQIRTKLDRQEYRPGQKATIDLELVDSAGRPTPGAISLSAVDEAVYAVLSQPVANEQSVFTLDEGLLQPVLALHPWSPQSAVDGRAADRNEFEQAIFARGSAPSPNDIEALRDRLANSSEIDRSAFDILDRTDWQDYLPSYGASPRTLALLRNDAVHTLNVTTYPAKLRQAESVQRDGLQFVTGLWIVFVVIGLCCLVAICAYELSSSLVFAVCAPILFLIVGAMLLPAVQAAREASVRTQMRNSMRQLVSATETTTTTAQGEGYNYNLPNVDFWGQLETRDTGRTEGLAPPRLRQWFPETVLWRPELITDDHGVAHVNVDLADSITTWRLNASAVSAAGQLGAAQSPLRVFQPFFVDVDLPVSLTRGDEVALPIVVHNYLDKPQSVTVTVDDAAWFQRLDAATKTFALGPAEVRAVAWRIRVRKVGEQNLQVTAQGSGVADAVKRAVSVVADGRRVEQVVNGTLLQPKSIDFEWPNKAIEGSDRSIVKIYPSSFSQLVEGLDAIFQLPYGCFEQTSSTTYPNLLALDYLRRTKTSAPAIEAKAREYIHLGYQRLLSFEVPGGGFEWFGHPPANRILTAYGLMEFEHMARVHDVDRSVIDRTRKWLLGQRNADGSWEPEWHGLADGAMHGGADLGRLASTAYVAWAVFGDGAAHEQAWGTLAFLMAHSPETINDPYTLALVANALLAIDPAGSQAAPYVARLEAFKRESDGGKRVWWQQRPTDWTMFYSGGQSGNVETTALATLALLSAKRSPETIHGALAWLIEQKQGYGVWGSTQATVLALRALITATGKPVGGERPRRIQLTLDGKELPEIVIGADEAQVMRQVDLSSQLRPGRHTLQLVDVSGAGAGFQLVSSYFVPGSFARPTARGLEVDVTYDRQQLPVNGLLTATATVENKRDQRAPMILIELPIPAGFMLDTESFAKLVEVGTIAKFQTRAQTALVYLRGIDNASRVTLSYRMRATMPATLSVPAAVAYEYYNADERATSSTTQLVVVPESDAKPAPPGAS